MDCGATLHLKVSDHGSFLGSGYRNHPLILAQALCFHIVPVFLNLQTTLAAGFQSRSGLSAVFLLMNIVFPNPIAVISRNVGGVILAAGAAALFQITAAAAQIRQIHIVGHISGMVLFFVRRPLFLTVLTLQIHRYAFLTGALEVQSQPGVVLCTEGFLQIQLYFAIPNQPEIEERFLIARFFIHFCLILVIDHAAAGLTDMLHSTVFILIAGILVIAANVFTPLLGFAAGAAIVVYCAAAHTQILQAIVAHPIAGMSVFRLSGLPNDILTVSTLLCYIVAGFAVAGEFFNTNMVLFSAFVVECEYFTVCCCVGPILCFLRQAGIGDTVLGFLNHIAQTAVITPILFRFGIVGSAVAAAMLDPLAGLIAAGAASFTVIDFATDMIPGRDNDLDGNVTLGMICIDSIIGGLIATIDTLPCYGVSILAAIAQQVVNRDFPMFLPLTGGLDGNAVLTLSDIGIYRGIYVITGGPFYFGLRLGSFQTNTAISALLVEQLAGFIVADAFKITLSVFPAHMGILLFAAGTAVNDPVKITAQAHGFRCHTGHFYPVVTTAIFDAVAAAQGHSAIYALPLHGVAFLAGLAQQGKHRYTAVVSS